jgi:hypothetical protein
MHPERVDRLLAVEVLDHVTVELVERVALTGRERRRLVVDLRRSEEAGIAGVLVGLGYLDVDSLERILGVLGRDGLRLRDLDDHGRAVVEVVLAIKAALDEMLAWDKGDA